MWTSTPAPAADHGATAERCRAVTSGDPAPGLRYCPVTRHPGQDWPQRCVRVGRVGPACPAAPRHHQAPARLIARSPQQLMFAENEPPPEWKFAEIRANARISSRGGFAPRPFLPKSKHSENREGRGSVFFLQISASSRRKRRFPPVSSKRKGR